MPIHGPDSRCRFPTPRTLTSGSRTLILCTARRSSDAVPAGLQVPSRAVSTIKILIDPSHHLTGPFTPSAPPSPAPPPPATAPNRHTDGHTGPHSPKPSLARGAPAAADVSPWLRWAVDPLSALRALAVPPLLALPTALLLPFVRPLVPMEWAGYVGNPRTLPSFAPATHLGAM
ncbi:hypothetical protein DFH06DRAFT_1481685 [Mycena polygramma]|nr:hypothetical protein DFH06DRAFT_1481685 [Mycena polygramma]